MSLETLLEAAKYLDHIQKTGESMTSDDHYSTPLITSNIESIYRLITSSPIDLTIDSSDGERHDSVGNDSFEESEEMVLPSTTYHLKVDPNVPISVQFHTYTSCGAGLQPIASMTTPSEGMSNTWNTSNISTKRNAHQNGGHLIVNDMNNSSSIRPTTNQNNSFSINTINTVNNNNNTNNSVNSINNNKRENRDHSSYSRHREMHKTLEKNRRAHLRHCFEVLKDELPPNEYNEKKSSHINIISCAIRYIQHLKRTESELDNQTERLVRTKIRFQNQIAQLKEDLKDLSVKTGIGGIGAHLQADQTHRSLHLTEHCLQYEPPIDEQSDEEVIIELQTGEECYDDETTTTASECADDIRETGNTSQMSGSLASALIYKCHA